MRKLQVVGALLFCLPGMLAAAVSYDGLPDYEREQRLTSEIKDAIFDGEVLSLKEAERDFMAIHMSPEGESKGAVIILHGRGYHADWEDVAHPLRMGLPKQGWHTLSLQMPVLDKSAKYYDYLPLMPFAALRIEAGIRYLREQGIDRVVLLAHSCGAHMALDWIDSKGDGAIDAFIGAGMGATDYGQPMKKDYPLDRMKVPVLDVYGEKEHPGVLRMAPARKSAIEQAGHPLSAQKVLPGADHYFTGIKEPLVELITQWLNTLPKD